MKFAFAAALALLTASSLHAQTAAAAAPPAPPAPATIDLTFAKPIEGTWSYAATGGGSEVAFRDASARVQLTIRCTRALRQVTIAKPASAAAPFLFVWTS